MPLYAFHAGSYPILNILIQYITITCTCACIIDMLNTHLRLVGICRLLCCIVSYQIASCRTQILPTTKFSTASWSSVIASGNISISTEHENIGIIKQILSSVTICNVFKKFAIISNSNIILMAYKTLNTLCIRIPASLFSPSSL